MKARCPSPCCGNSVHEVLEYTPSAEEAAYGYTLMRILPFHRRVKREGRNLVEINEPCIFEHTRTRNPTVQTPEARWVRWVSAQAFEALRAWQEQGIEGAA